MPRTLVCIVQPCPYGTSETFLRAHAERLPAEITVVHTGGTIIPHVGDRPVLSQANARRALRKAGRILSGRAWEWEITQGYIAAFRRYRSQVVLAQYGTTGVAVMNACRLAGLPLVVHFHGF